MKQTAVEWYTEKTFNQIELLKRGYVNQEEFLGGMLKLRDQAKEMEKEQMVDFAFKYGDLTTREIADSFDKEYKTNEK